MNHGPKFQKVSSNSFLGSVADGQLMADIKDDVRKMQSKGNYGDGKQSGSSWPGLTRRVLVRWAEIER